MKLSNTCTFNPGIHLATVTSIKIARDHEGKPVANKETGEVSIRIEFRGSNEMNGSIFVPVSEHTQYITDSLIRACRLSNKTKEVDVKDVIGVKLWIYVKGIYSIGTHPGIDPPLRTEIMPAKYSQFLGPKPSNIEEPDCNGGIPKGMFVEFVDVRPVKDAINLDEREFGDD